MQATSGGTRFTVAPHASIAAVYLSAVSPLATRCTVSGISVPASSAPISSPDRYPRSTPADSPSSDRVRTAKSACVSSCGAAWPRRTPSRKPALAASSWSAKPSPSTECRRIELRLISRKISPVMKVRKDCTRPSLTTTHLECVPGMQITPSVSRVWVMSPRIIVSSPRITSRSDGATSVGSAVHVSPGIRWIFHSIELGTGTSCGATEATETGQVAYGASIHPLLAPAIPQTITGRWGYASIHAPTLACRCSSYAAAVSSAVSRAILLIPPSDRVNASGLPRADSSHARKEEVPQSTATIRGRIHTTRSRVREAVMAATTSGCSISATSRPFTSRIWSPRCSLPAASPSALISSITL
mmetsp:Transcript_20992/g.54656  ORF Transcript_20992/g.54656 Transcript_20992/m.54656 type:complete len:358 (-) Transcript_20992:137-1210(-)